jgi:ketosteroid isomerase-like protein
MGWTGRECGPTLRAMFKTAMVVAAAVWLTSIPVRAASDEETAKEIVAMERRAMDGWITGNPDPALAIADPEISYFHVMTEKRLDGLAAVKELFERYRGMPLYESYQMGDLKVVVHGDVAVLTYLLIFQKGGAANRWNATEVYQRKMAGWRVIHSHWSQTRPGA